jgi:hypothetical protein
MSEPILWGPNGIPVQKEPEPTGGPVVTVDYSGRTGLGSVNLTLNGTRYNFTVKEARQLGVQLTVESETAMMVAGLFRVMTELGGYSLEEAAAVYQTMMARVRVQHRDQSAPE